jgi:SAM-dependent methyltransferase
MDEIKKCWDQKAAQWKKWVGERGDNNRFFNSDPVLWKFAGDVKGLEVLDAGCGTGYLSISLTQKGAKVIGVDISPNMIQEAQSMAQAKSCEIDFRVDSCETLSTLKDNSVDLIISNYVLMDLPNLDAAVSQYYRVLRKDGKAVFIIGHPFSGGLAPEENYFDEVKKVDRWGPFDSDFIFFHRPISQYWKSFKRASFIIEDFDEPVAEDPTVPGFKPEWRTEYRKKPWSMAFLLKK